MKWVMTYVTDVGVCSPPHTPLSALGGPKNWGRSLLLGSPYSLLLCLSLLSHPPLLQPLLMRRREESCGCGAPLGPPPPAVRRPLSPVRRPPSGLQILRVQDGSSSARF